MDFFVLTNEKGMDEIRSKIKKKGIYIDKDWNKWNPLLGKIQTRLIIRDIPVDLLLARNDYEKLSFKRRKRKKIGNFFLSVVAPEDFILQKLKVGRPRDFEDAVTVLERMKDKLNMSYLKKWAKQLGITEELNYIINI